MTTIPDPERTPDPDNIIEAITPQQRPDTFRPGEIVVNPIRHGGVRFSDEDGRTVEINDIEDDPEDPEAIVGNAVIYNPDGSATEAKFARAKRRIQESRAYQLTIEEHPKATGVTVGAVAIGGVVLVASLIVRRKRRSS